MTTTPHFETRPSMQTQVDAERSRALPIHALPQLCIQQRTHSAADCSDLRELGNIYTPAHTIRPFLLSKPHRFFGSGRAQWLLLHPAPPQFTYTILNIAPGQETKSFHPRSLWRHLCHV
jgi:hypothetical protein